MSYFKPKIDATGIHIPDYVTIRDYLLNEFLRIFGQDLYLGEDAQDYQMISLFATAIDDVNALAIEAYNNRNPDFARGNALDLILPMNGIIRFSPTHSTVTLKITGEELAEVEAGSIAIDQRGNRWIIQSRVEIPETLSIEVEARSEIAGRFLAGIGSVNQIGTPTNGWTSVTNEAAAIPGRPIETDAEVRARRLASIENTAIGIVAALTGSLYELSEVKKAKVYENSTGTEQPVTAIPAHSICVVVDGGDSAEIAKLIYKKKSPGCGLFGDIIETIQDEFGNSVNVSFLRAVDAPVKVKITMKKFLGYADVITDNIKLAVAEYITGLNIGQTVETGLVWGIVLDHNPTNMEKVYAPTNIQIAFLDGALSETSINPSFDERASCNVEDVEVIFLD